MTTTTYKVTGMTCEHCANAVTTEVSALGGVSAVQVQLVPNGVSLVTVASAALLPEPEVSAALDMLDRFDTATSDNSVATGVRSQSQAFACSNTASFGSAERVAALWVRWTAAPPAPFEITHADANGAPAHRSHSARACADAPSENFIS